MRPMSGASLRGATRRATRRHAPPACRWGASICAFPSGCGWRAAASMWPRAAPASWCKGRRASTSRRLCRARARCWPYACRAAVSTRSNLCRCPPVRLPSRPITPPSPSTRRTSASARCSAGGRSGAPMTLPWPWPACWMATRWARCRSISPSSTAPRLATPGARPRPPCRRPASAAMTLWPMKRPPGGAPSGAVAPACSWTRQSIRRSMTWACIAWPAPRCPAARPWACKGRGSRMTAWPPGKATIISTSTRRCATGRRWRATGPPRSSRCGARCAAGCPRSRQCPSLCGHRRWLLAASRRG